MTMQPTSYSPWGCEVRFVSFPQQQGSKGTTEEHICSRQCAYSQVCGNLYACATSGSTHVCDQNCNQRIYYDSYRTICRLSKKLFPNTEAAMSDGASGKRASDSDCEMERLASQKRSLSEQEWATQQALQDAAPSNAAWCKGEVAAWAGMQRQQHAH